MTLTLPGTAARSRSAGCPPVSLGLHSRATTVAAVVVLVVFVLVAACGLAWRVSGGTWAVIESPSMGRAAPVGTLILIEDKPMSQVVVGDVITFRPPNNPAQLYTHRVVHKYDDGTVQVRGDINGAADPLPIADADLVGRVVSRLHGLGWLVKALPSVILAVVVLLVATRRYLPARWCSSARVLGTCFIFAAASLILRPFVRPILVAVDPEPSANGRHQANIVSGGLFPTRVTGADGVHVDLRAGETGVVPVVAEQAGGPLMVSGSPHLDGLWLVGVVVVSLLPMLWCLIVGLAPEEQR